MGKSENDEDYERGVRDGQRGNFLDDVVQAQFGDSYTPYGEGYNYGVEHRYGSEGQRYHSWDGSGTNDPKEKSEESGRIYREEPTGSSDYGGSGGGGYLGYLIALGILLTIPIGIGGMIKEYKNEKQKRLLRANHRVKRYEPITSSSEEILVLTDGSQDFSLSPEGNKLVYSKKVRYEWNHPLSKPVIVEHEITSPLSTLIERHRIFQKDLETGLEEMIGVKEANLQLPYSRERDVIKEISWEYLVAPMYSPNAEKIAFASTRGDHGSALCLMDNSGTEIQRLSEEFGCIAYGWVSDDVLYLWINGAGNFPLINYEYYKRGQGCLINTSIDERVEIDNLPKTNFPIPIRYVSFGRVEKFVIENDKESVSRTASDNVWKKTWGNFQRAEREKESLMDEKTLIKTRLEKWIEKHNNIGKFNLLDYDVIGENTWALIKQKGCYPNGTNYLFCSKDRKSWELKWREGPLSQSPFDIEFLNEDEGYIVTGESLFYTSDKGSNWGTLLSKGYWWGEPEIVDFKINNTKLIIKLRKGQIYTSSDKGKTWEELDKK